MRKVPLVAFGSRFHQTSGISRSSFLAQRLFCSAANEQPPKIPPAKPNFISEKIQLYAGLSKFRLSALVVVTSGAGYMAAGVPFSAEGNILLSAF